MLNTDSEAQRCGPTRVQYENKIDICVEKKLTDYKMTFVLNDETMNTAITIDVLLLYTAACAACFENG